MWERIPLVRIQTLVFHYRHSEFSLEFSSVPIFLICSFCSSLLLKGLRRTDSDKLPIRMKEQIKKATGFFSFWKHYVYFICTSRPLTTSLVSSWLCWLTIKCPKSLVLIKKRTKAITCATHGCSEEKCWENRRRTTGEESSQCCSVFVHSFTAGMPVHTEKCCSLI